MYSETSNDELHTGDIESAYFTHLAEQTNADSLARLLERVLSNPECTLGFTARQLTLLQTFVASSRENLGNGKHVSIGEGNTCEVGNNCAQQTSPNALQSDFQTSHGLLLPEDDVEYLHESDACIIEEDYCTFERDSVSSPTGGSWSTLQSEMACYLPEGAGSVSERPIFEEELGEKEVEESPLDDFAPVIDPESSDEAVHLVAGILSSEPFARKVAPRGGIAKKAFLSDRCPSEKQATPLPFTGSSPTPEQQPRKPTSTRNSALPTQGELGSASGQSRDLGGFENLGKAVGRLSVQRQVQHSMFRTSGESYLTGNKRRAEGFHHRTSEVPLSRNVSNMGTAYEHSRCLKRPALNSESKSGEPLWAQEDSNAASSVLLDHPGREDGPPAIAGGQTQAHTSLDTATALPVATPGELITMAKVQVDAKKHPTAFVSPNAAAVVLSIPSHPPTKAQDESEQEASLWGLPKEVFEIYGSRGIHKFYAWQEECLQHSKVMEGCNLVYSLPTSGGKTLVAEVMLMRCAYLKNKKAIFVLPYVTIVTQKVQSMKEFGNALNFRVEGYYGNQGSIPPRKGNQLAVCTIEKANSLINSMAEEGRLAEIDLVVVDELHMIGEGERGYYLELLLTKVKYLSKGAIQIIGMSATIPNISDICSWLDASLYQGTFRPVPLKEYIKVPANKLPAKDKTSKKLYQGAILYDKQGREEKKYYTKKLPDPENESKMMVDSLTFLDLCLEVIPENNVLIFCPTKKSTQETAKYIYRFIRALDKLSLRMKGKTQRPRMSLKIKTDAQKLLLRRLKNKVGTVDKTFQQIVLYGVAYHHSGLTEDERLLVERAFSQKEISVLCSTSTLAAGVNLPARRVILRSLKIGSECLTPKRYLQMSGRAGRAGIDEYGESILMVAGNELELAKELVNSPMKPVESMLCPRVRQYERHTAVRENTLSPDSTIDDNSANGQAGQGKCPFEQSREQQHSVPAGTTQHTSNIGASKNNNEGMLKLVMESVASGLTSTDVELATFTSLTFAATKRDSNAIVTRLLEAVKYLNFHKFIAVEQRVEEAHTNDILMAAKPSSGIHKTIRTRGVLPPRELQAFLVGQLRSQFGGGPLEFRPSLFGSAAQRSSFTADEALYIKSDIERAMEHLILTDELHLCYLVSPPGAMAYLWDWNMYSNRLSRLSEAHTSIMQQIGVFSYLWNRIGSGKVNRTLEKNLKRFYTALILYDLVTMEKPPYKVAAEYNIPRGKVQEIMRTAAIFAGRVVHFCLNMEWRSMEALLKTYIHRLNWGVREEVLPLMEIKGVTRVMARVLFNAGFRTVKSIAQATPENISKKVVFTAMAKPERIAEKVVRHAKQLMEEKAKKLRLEAEDLMNEMEAADTVEFPLEEPGD